MVFHPFGLLRFILPDGEVFIVQVRRRQTSAFVKVSELFDQHASGHAVGNDMMHIQQQQVFLFIQSDKSGPNERSRAQIKRLNECLNDKIRFLLVRCFKDVQVNVSLFCDLLHRLAFLIDKGRPQRFVAVDHLIERFLKP
ncbi:hypothetical protein BN2127_JRS8_01361 [Bacillus amyloliquefaciens]|nr:hypothetical protein BN2127_JRS8_01361 [Bacillus amyloliquefaciens]